MSGVTADEILEGSPDRPWRFEVAYHTAGGRCSSRGHGGVGTGEDSCKDEKRTAGRYEAHEETLGWKSWPVLDAAPRETILFGGNVLKLRSRPPPT
jgi:hypothetical protein